MVNTVGSCENKHWQKKWIEVKRQLSLSPRQRSFIIGSLLGDGTMRVGKKGANANFKVEHGLKQRDYVFWKYELLREWVYMEPQISTRSGLDGRAYAKSWWFRTVRHPLLTSLYDRFYTRDTYRVGRKIVPHDIGRDLDAFTLAVWIMDDGSCHRDCIDISTYSFRLPEIRLLQDAIASNFDVRMGYHADGDRGYRLYCNKRESQKLARTICPYLVPSMRYKIGSH